VYRRIGERASGTEAGRGRRSLGSVEEREGVVAERRATLDERRRVEAGARETLAERTGVREGELAALSGKEERDRLQAAVREAARAVRLAERALAEAEDALGAAREDLGRSVHLAGFDAPEVRDQVRRAGELSRSIAALEGEIRAQRAVVDETRRVARRFLLAVGAALVLGMVGLALLLGGGDGDRATSRADRAEGARETVPDEPRPAGGRTAAELAPEIRDAVLAHPALATREEDGIVLFRSSGRLAVVSEEPGADGTRRLVLDADAESRPAPDGELAPMTLRFGVTVDARGRLVRADVRTTLTQSDVELERLLEEWR
jgi:hypothetical protein